MPTKPATRPATGANDTEVIDAVGTDLATVVEGHMLTLTEVDRNNVGAFLAAIKETESEDDSTAQIDIIARILRAESTDDVLGGQRPVGLKERLGWATVVKGVRWMRSEFDEGPGAYAVIDCADPATGETFIATCGGVNVLAQLFALDRLGAFPVVVMPTRAAKATRNGYFPLWLEPAPASEPSF